MASGRQCKRKSPGSIVLMVHPWYKAFGSARGLPFSDSAVYFGDGGEGVVGTVLQRRLDPGDGVAGPANLLPVELEARWRQDVRVPAAATSELRDGSVAVRADKVAYEP